MCVMCCHHILSLCVVIICCHNLMLSPCIVTMCCHHVLSPCVVTMCCHHLLSSYVVTICYYYLLSSYVVTILVTICVVTCHYLIKLDVMRCHKVLSPYIVPMSCHNELLAYISQVHNHHSFSSHCPEEQVVGRIFSSCQLAVGRAGEVLVAVTTRYHQDPPLGCPSLGNTLLSSCEP